MYLSLPRRSLILFTVRVDVQQEKEPPVQNGINPAAVEFVPIANSPAAKSAAAAAAAAANRSNGFGGNSSDQSGTDSSSNTSRQSTTTTTSDSYG